METNIKLSLGEITIDSDDNIEIKVFSGDSSLRRKLTKCVDIGISTISSGLPLKECNKVINKDKCEGLSIRWPLILFMPIFE